MSTPDSTAADLAAELDLWARTVPAQTPPPAPCMWIALLGRLKLPDLRAADESGRWPVPDTLITGWQVAQLERIRPGDLLLLACLPSMPNRITTWEGVRLGLCLLWEIRGVTIRPHIRQADGRRMAGEITGRPLARLRDVGPEHLSERTLNLLRLSSNQSPRLMDAGTIELAVTVPYLTAHAT